jgi:lipooligosaccharide transport system permease protein
MSPLLTARRGRAFLVGRSDPGVRSTGLRAALWGGACYSAGFLLLMQMMGLLETWLALLAIPAGLLVSFSFGAVGTVLAILVKGGQDFEIVQIGLVALSLFSATFFPVDAYQGGWRVVVEVSPLYRAVILLRELCTGLVTLNSLYSVIYLVALGLAALKVTAWLSERTSGR